MADTKTFVLAIVGPTASGKSAISIMIAGRLNGEIVSADSMMVYKGMDIGTAKPPPVLREQTPHHLIDVIEPVEEFSAAAYQEMARRAIDDITARGRLPIVAGGTGLYVSAVLDNLHFPQRQETSLERRRLEEEADRLGAFELHKRLESVDPVAASNIHVNNVRRVVRALEVYELTGRKYSEVAGAFKKRSSVYDTAFIGIEFDKDELNRRIETRTRKMMDAGWAKETARLLASGSGLSKTAAKAIGYREMRQYLDGMITIDEAADKIVKATKAYAKRQMTWFKADPRIVWLKATTADGAEGLADEVILYLKSNGKGVSA